MRSISRIFNLKRLERAAIAILAGAALLGVAVMAYRKAGPEMYLKTGKFKAPDAIASRFDRRIANPEKVNINTADIDGLMKLERVGKTLAGRIIEYRTRHGAFRSIEEIKNVKGIGRRLFERIKDDISVE
jgi:competence ComEA-like helix-hairpin-helix protein